jgi:hypothetical protein
LAVRLNEFNRVFANRVKSLDASMWKPEPDGETTF